MGGMIALILLIGKAIFNSFLSFLKYTKFFCRNHNPLIRLLTRAWRNLIGLLYQITFTISKAIQDSKRSDHY
jgi:hypothetical protein